MYLETKDKIKIVSSPFVCAAGSDMGKLRLTNEDAFIFDVVNSFFLVVDGMGGHSHGEIAARIATETIQTAIRKIENSAKNRLLDSIILANNAIFENAQKDSLSMGCVLTAIIFENENAVIGHVGDTRLYQIQKGNILKLTTDHSYVGELEESGHLSETRLMRHPRRNEVTRCLGFEEKTLSDESFVEIIDAPFHADMAFLLCSDGLSDLLTSTKILEIVEENAASPQDVVRNLIEEANKAGGKDNITVIFIAGRHYVDSLTGEPERSKLTSKQKLAATFLSSWGFLLYGIAIGGGLVFLLFYMSWIPIH